MTFTDKRADEPALTVRKKRYNGFYLPEDGTESALPCQTCYGLLQRGKTLVSGETIAPLNGETETYFPASSPVRFFRYDYERDGEDYHVLFAYAADGYLYKSDGAGVFTRTAVSFSAPPEGICYRTIAGADDIAFVGAPYSYLYDGAAGTYTILSSVPAARAAALHYERLFLVESGSSCRLRFSRALDIDDWEESLQGAGYVELPDEGGAITRLLPFGGRLYLIRERGMTRLRALGDNLNFTAERQDVFAGRILADSACVCGEVILFLTENGLYAFDGDGAKGICRGVLPAGVVSCSRAAYAKGRYYVGFVSADGGKRMLCADPEKEEGYLLPFYAPALAGMGEEAVCADEEGLLYRFAPSLSCEGNGSAWDSGLTDFSLGGGARVWKRLFLDADGIYTLTAYGERGSVSRSFEGRARLSPLLKGELFGVKIEGKGLILRSLEVEFDEY